MENLSHDDNSNSDSDDLPAVGVVLQGYRIAQKKKLICAVNSNANENARYFKLQTGGRAREERDSLRGHKNGFRGLKEKCESIQNQGPTKHGRVNLLENRRAHKYQHVIKGESNETDPNEPELERDQTNLAAMAVTGKGVLLERASLEERRQLPSIEHNRRAERSASQPWKSIHASQLGRGDEGTDIGSDGALEVQFTNNKIPPGTSSSDNNDNNSRSNSSSDERPSPLSSGQNNRAAALDSNSPINGGYGIYKPSELNSDINSSLSSPVKKEQQKYPRISSTSKHRESIDAFWRQSLVNEWNDYYSPKKINFSPPKKAHSERQCAPGFPTLYNHEKEDGTVTPKAERDAVRRKKTFQATKHKTAEAFFAEIDQKMTGGRIAGMSKSTGGVKLIWSKKLISTAGRAHWKRTIPKIEKMCNDTDEVEQHHVSIELAEKVIDDEGRLKNVIAHEFCHLANFMISNVKGNPHGKSFKEWARRCSDVFACYGVEVTTKHSYDIDYRYIWQCLSCNILFKRHSKSIDPTKQACGSCTSKLVQIKPVPRIYSQTDYQLFVKSHFQRVKSENSKASHGYVMQILGALYKQEQRNNASANSMPATVESLNEKLQSLTVNRVS